MKSFINKDVSERVYKQGVAGFTQVIIQVPNNFKYIPFDYCIPRQLFSLINFQNNLMKCVMNESSFHDVEIITEDHADQLISFNLPKINLQCFHDNCLTFYVSTDRLMKALDEKYSETIVSYGALQKLNIDLSDNNNLDSETVFQILVTCEMIDEISNWNFDNLKEINSEFPERINNSLLPLIFKFENGKFNCFSSLEGVIRLAITNFLKSSSVGLFEKRRIMRLAQQVKFNEH